MKFLKYTYNILLIGCLSLLVSCIGESETISPDILSNTFSGNPEGTTDVEISGFYPANGSTSVPIDSNLVITFTKEIDVSIETVANNFITVSGATINTISRTGDNRVAVVTFTADLSYNTAYTVTINTGITSTESTPLDTTYVYTFTTIADSSATAYPQMVTTSLIPLDTSTDIDINSGSVYVTFTKDMNGTTINGSTFTISPAVASGAPVAVGSRTYRLPINTMAYDTSYTVTLDNSTIADTDGNLLTGGDYDWTFTTEEHSSGGSGPGTQAIDSVWITNTGTTSTEINFNVANPIQTDQSTINYGTDTGFGSSQAGTGSTSSSYHKITVTGLTAGTRYYFQVDANGTTTTDFPSTTPTEQLTFVTTEGNSVVSNSAGDKDQINASQNQAYDGSSPYDLVYDGSSFVIWDENNTSIYGHYFDNSTPPTLPWGANGDQLYNSTASNIKTFNDDSNGVIITYESGGDIYAKRVYNNGGAADFGFPAMATSSWGSNLSATGINIGSGSNLSATIMNRVFNNFDTSTSFNSSITSVANGDAEAFADSANYIYDYDVNFSSAGITTGAGQDFIINRSTSNVSEISSVGAGVSYRHVIEQTTDVVNSSDTYSIADISTTQAYTATDHTIRNTTTEALVSSYQSSGINQYLYSEEGATIAGWLSNNDVIYDGTNYRVIQAISSINFSSGNSTVRTGSTDNGNIPYLRSTGNLGTVVVGDFVINSDTGDSATVTSIVDAGNEVELSSAIFQASGGGENFRIYSPPGAAINSGTDSGLIISPRLYDFGNSWGADGVTNDDIVQNSTTGDYTYITDDSNIGSNYLVLATHIFTAGGDNYNIYGATTIRATTTSSTNYTDKLVDTTENFTTGTSVQVGDVVENTSTGNFARVTAVTATVLELDADIFTTTGQGYTITNGSYNASVYSAGTTNNPFDSFIRFQAYSNISTADSTGLTAYNYLRTGTADSRPANPLFDDGGNFASVQDNDFVANLSTGDRTRVDNSSFTIETRALDLDSDIFNNGDDYNILNFNPSISDTDILAYGVTSTATTTLTDGSKNFNTATVTTGDIVYSIDSDDYGVVTAVTATTLTLNRDIFSSTGEFYLVLNSGIAALEVGIIDGTDTTGLTVTDDDADFTNVQAGDILRDISDGDEAIIIHKYSSTQLELSSNILSLNDRYIIVQPRLLAAYESSGDILSTIVNLRDGTTHATVDICTHGNTTTNPYVINNQSDRNIIIYNNTTDGTIRGKAIDAGGDFVIGSPSTAIGTSIVSGTILDVQYDKNNGVYILYDSGTNNILTRRNNGLSTPGGWSNISLGSNSNDTVFTTDSSGNLFVAYNDNNNDVNLSKYNTSGTVQWTTALTALFSYENESTSNLLKISPDNNNGVFVAWADNRYYIENGLVAMLQHVDASGTRSWDADSDTSTDWNGFFFGGTGTYDNNLTDLINLVLYNDGGSPLGINAIWRDERDGDFDIYYRIKAP